MSPAPIALAVYGTLRRGERNDQFLAGATFLGHGRIAGRLHLMASSDVRAYPYPALVAADDGEVVVELFLIPDAATLAAADDLERYDPADEAGSEYVRRAVPVRGGPVAEAWVYVYNGPHGAMGDRIGDDWVTHANRAGP